MRVEKIWTSWKVVYVTIVVVWAFVIFINYMTTEDDFNDIKNELGGNLGDDNWVRIAGALGLASAATLMLCIIYAVGRDPGKWETIGDIMPRVARFFMQVSSELVSLCTISVVSVYLYLHEGTVRTTLSGAPWVVVLGVILFCMIIIDRVIFINSLSPVN